MGFGVFRAGWGAVSCKTLYTTKPRPCVFRLLRVFARSVGGEQGSAFVWLLMVVRHCCNELMIPVEANTGILCACALLLLTS